MTFARRTAAPMMTWVRHFINVSLAVRQLRHACHWPIYFRRGWCHTAWHIVHQPLTLDFVLYTFL